MNPRSGMSRSLLTILGIALCLSFPFDASAGKKKANKPIRNPKFDPSAEQVDIFDAIDAKQISVRLIPKDATGGNVFVENLTDKPLTVKVPDALGAVSIHSQFAGGGLGGGGLGGGGLGGGGLGGGGGAGQALGGGLGGGGQGGGGIGGGGIGGGGGGFFSVPAESVASIRFHSVCLEHGKPEPTLRSRYTLVPISRVNPDPVLNQLLKLVGTGSVDSQAAQAAAWHLSNKMSFGELEAKMVEHLGAVAATPYFTREQLREGEQLVIQAKNQAKLELDLPKAKEKETSTIRRNSGDAR